MPLCVGHVTIGSANCEPGEMLDSKGHFCWRVNMEMFFLHVPRHSLHLYEVLELRLKSENPNQHIRNVADGTLFTLPYSVLWF